MAGGPGGNPTYFCNIVTTFAPCAANGGYTGAGGTQPINYFQMNPLNSGQDVGLTTAAGYSNYNGLQIDFRQKQWHGMQFDANYTWSHTLGINTQNSWTGVFNQFSLRNLRQSYGPLPFDIRNSFHVNGTYDLPFGAGKQFSNQTGSGGQARGRMVRRNDRNVAERRALPAARRTVNQRQHFLDVQRLWRQRRGVEWRDAVTTTKLSERLSRPGQTTVDLINPKYLSSTGANPAFITPNTKPGAFRAESMVVRASLFQPRHRDQQANTNHRAIPLVVPE